MGAAVIGGSDGTLINYPRGGCIVKTGSTRKVRLGPFEGQNIGKRLDKAGTIVEVFRRHYPLPGGGPFWLLDVGAGLGVTGQAVAGELGARCVQVDVANELSSGTGSFVLGSGEVLPFSQRTFDLVIANHVIEHVSDQEAFLKGIRRVLKPEGLCYLATPNKYGLFEPHYRIPLLSWLPKPLADGLVRRAGRGSLYEVNPLSRADLRHITQAAGFEAKDLTVDVISDPRRYRRRDLYARLGGLAPRPMIRLLSALAPSYIWLLQAAIEHGDTDI